jgi:hypothetical protein
MAYSARVFKVMIASPGDVSRERQLATGVIHSWNDVHSQERKQVLLPVAWETHSSPVMGDRPQEIINKQILRDCDLLVAMFWTRLGTPTGKAASGTAEEIQEHVEAGKSAMLYFSSEPVALDSVDHEQYSALKQFKEECRKRGLFVPYDSTADFRDKFSKQLMQTVIREFPASSDSQLKAAIPPTPDVPILSEMARLLLVEAAADPGGVLIRVPYLGGTIFQASGKKLVDENDKRAVASGERALKELEALGLLESAGYNREAFDVTHEGYRVSDLIQNGVG